MNKLPEQPVAEPYGPRELAVYAVQEEATYVSNIEAVLSDQPASGEYAQKVNTVSPRSLWYPGYRHFVLPKAPDPDFRKYLQVYFGIKPDVIVPAGIDHDALTITDGMDDRRFRAALSNVVESYVPDGKIARAVSDNGGTYAGGLLIGDRRRLANDKAAFAGFAEGILEVPEGAAFTGLKDIAGAVRQRLTQKGSAFVRHTQSGGGFGNRSFDVEKDGPYTLKSIVAKLKGSRPEIWATGQALVEEHLGRIAQAPSINFAWMGASYSSLQLTQGGNYRGHISPVPEEVASHDSLMAIGSRFVTRLRERTGYFGPGSVDMGVVDNRLLGFECNARYTGTRHGIAIGELLVGPWSGWRDNNDVVASIDHFTLRRPMRFGQLYAILDREGLLATKNHPWGVVISIPPHGDIAGIHIQGTGYPETMALHREVDKLVGSPGKNIYDGPIDFRA